MTAEWYYAKGGEQAGPVTDDELRGLAGAGRLAANDLVWKQGMTKWMPAGQVKGLFVGTPVRATAPPPLPNSLNSIASGARQWFGAAAGFIDKALHVERLKSLPGYWEAADGSAKWIQFTHDGAILFCDGAAGKYSISGAEPNEVVRLETVGGSAREWRVISFSLTQLVVSEGANSLTFTRRLLKPSTASNLSSAISSLLGGGALETAVDSQAPTATKRETGSSSVTYPASADGISDQAVAEEVAKKRSSAQWHALPAETKTTSDEEQILFSGDGPCPKCGTMIWVDWKNTTVCMMCPNCRHRFNDEEAIEFLSAHESQQNYKPDLARTAVELPKILDRLKTLVENTGLQTQSASQVKPEAQGTGKTPSNKSLLSRACKWLALRRNEKCPDCGSRDTQERNTRVIDRRQEWAADWAADYYSGAHGGQPPPQAVFNIVTYESECRCNDCGAEWIQRTQSGTRA